MDMVTRRRMSGCPPRPARRPPSRVRHRTPSTRRFPIPVSTTAARGGRAVVGRRPCSPPHLGVDENSRRADAAVLHRGSGRISVDRLTGDGGATRRPEPHDLVLVAQQRASIISGRWPAPRRGFPASASRCCPCHRVRSRPITLTPGAIGIGPTENPGASVCRTLAPKPTSGREAQLALLPEPHGRGGACQTTRRSAASAATGSGVAIQIRLGERAG